MTERKIFSFVLLTFLLALTLVLNFSCSEDKVVSPPPGDINLITNSSFESNGSFSLQGWESSTTDTSYINFSDNVPDSGGSYSVRIKNEWSSDGKIWYNLVPPTGTNHYQLSIWGKTLTSNPAFTGGDLSLFLLRGGTKILQKSVHFSDTTWTKKSLLDTLTTSAADTVMIELTGNLDQFAGGYILFDLCRFEKLD